MRIRRAKPEDAEAVAVIQVRGWQEAYKDIMPDRHLAAMTVEARKSTWEQLLASGVTFVSESPTGITGFCSVGATRDDRPDGSRFGEIYALYVEPKLWRNGVGQGLCDAGLSWLRAEGFEAASLWVLEKNLIGRSFYEKAGFAADGGHEPYQASATTLTELRYTIGL